MMKLAIFDLDGTLANTIADLAGSVEITLKQKGLPGHSMSEYKQMVGNGYARLVERALPAEKRGGGFEASFRAEALAYYNEHLLDNTLAYPGMPETLLALQRQGIGLAVVTNKPQEAATAVVRGLFPSIRFLHVYGDRAGFPRKPDPAVALSVAREAGIGPDRTLYCGDSNVDVQTGHNAGMKVAGAAWGFRGEAELREAGADYIVFKPEELISIVNNKE